MSLLRSGTAILLLSVLVAVTALGSTLGARDASAHTMEPWKCKYLMYVRAEQGERYAWKQRCISYSRRHNAYHKYADMVTGTASWYGPGFYGKRTSCGVTHSTRSWHVAALYPHLAMCGLPLTVCSSFQRCVKVKVMDRGAWRDWRTDSRGLDLSPRVRDALKCGDVCRIRYTTEAH